MNTIRPKRLRPAFVPKYREYTAVLREIKEGEFTIISFNRISAAEENHKLLHTKEVLVRKIIVT